MRNLYKHPDITIKPADKGKSIVIMKTEDYIAEANRQVSNQEHYKTLDEDPDIHITNTSPDRPSMENGNYRQDH